MGTLVRMDAVFTDTSVTRAEILTNQAMDGDGNPPPSSNQLDWDGYQLPG